MSRKKTMLFLLVILTLVVSGCASFNAEPTMSLEDIQLTAQSAALTSVAQTAAAQPTSTSIPTLEPTPLPPPTEPPVVEALANVPAPVVIDPAAQAPVVIVQQPTQAASSGGGPKCDFLTADTKGQRTSVYVNNQTGSDVTLSYYLEPTKLDQCGSASTTIARGQIASLYLVEGCYFLYGWVNHPKNPTTTEGYSCIKASKNWTWVVKPTVINVKE